MVVDDVEAAVAYFVELGMEVQGDGSGSAVEAGSTAPNTLGLRRLIYRLCYLSGPGGIIIALTEELAYMTDRRLDAHGIRLDPDPFDQFNIALGYRVGGLVIVSGQASIDEAGDIVGVGDFDAQAEQTFANLRRVLEAGGSGLDKIVKVTIYLTDMANFPKIVELRAKYFTRPWPADTIVGVTALGLPELQIEIEAIALTDGEVR